MKRNKKKINNKAEVMSLITFSSDSRGGVRWVLLVKKHVDHQFEQKTAARLSILLDKITTGDIDPTTGTFSATAGRHEVKFSKSFQCFTVCIFTCVHIKHHRPLSWTVFHTCVPPLSLLTSPEGFSNMNSCRLTRVSITLVVKPIG